MDGYRLVLVRHPVVPPDSCALTHAAARATVLSAEEAAILVRRGVVRWGALRKSGGRAQTAPVEVPISDAEAMALALDEARRCPEWEDVPVGAVVVRDGVVLAAAGNERERLGDPTAHAEILALRAAAGRLGTWRLEGCTIYVTLEPCAMCAGAMVLSRVRRLVFGAVDPKGGFAGSLGDLVRHERLNHRLEVAGGVLANESADLLRAFFRERRPSAGPGGTGASSRGLASPPPR